MDCRVNRRVGGQEGSVVTAQVNNGGKRGVLGSLVCDAHSNYQILCGHDSMLAIHHCTWSGKGVILTFGLVCLANSQSWIP